MKVSLLDNIHVHQRNFPTLIEFLNTKFKDVSTILTKKHPLYPTLTYAGKYDNLSEIPTLYSRSFNEIATKLKSLTKNDLKLYQVSTINLWLCCRAELMSYLLISPNWHNEPIKHDWELIYEKAYEENYEQLVNSLAMAQLWVEHWFEERGSIYSNNMIFVFSGSQIYARTLIEVAKRGKTKIYVLESSLTGSDYYCIEMYSGIANNIPDPIKVKILGSRVNQERYKDNIAIKGLNKLILAKNKNVKPVEADILPAFNNPDEACVLIVTQVVNDFSLIEEGSAYINSIAAYIKIIESLLVETEYNIIVKTHPWEKEKIYINESLTYNAIANFVSNQSSEYKKRVMIVDEFDLASLFSYATYFVTISSQSSIEAAANGLKPFTIGEAFYTNNGFTETVSRLDDLIGKLIAQTGNLSLNEYDCFLNYLGEFFEQRTISVHPSGLKMLEKKFEVPSVIVELQKKTKESFSQESLYQRDPECQHLIIKKKRPNNVEELNEIKTLQCEIISFDKLLNTVALKLINTSKYIIPSVINNVKCMVSYHLLGASGERVVWNGESFDLGSDLVDEKIVTIQFELPVGADVKLMTPALVYPGLCWIESYCEVDLSENSSPSWSKA